MATSDSALTVKAAASLTAVPPTGIVVVTAPPKVTARSVPVLIDEPEVRCAMWTLVTVTAWLPNALDSCTRAAVPEMLVCTICRRVCWLKVVPLLCGETAQVPVQATAAAAAGAGAGGAGARRRRGGGGAG